jgi:hypothetical protein
VIFNAPNNIKVFKLKRIKLTGPKSRIGKKMHTEFWWGNLKERLHLEHLGVDWDVISKGISNKRYGAYSEELMLCSIGTSSEKLGPQ